MTCKLAAVNDIRDLLEDVCQYRIYYRPCTMLCMSCSVAAICLVLVAALYVAHI